MILRGGSELGGPDRWRAAIKIGRTERTAQETFSVW
jgi:hypothetical protein